MGEEGRIERERYRDTRSSWNVAPENVHHDVSQHLHARASRHRAENLGPEVVQLVGHGVDRLPDSLRDLLRGVQSAERSGELVPSPPLGMGGGGDPPRELDRISGVGALQLP